MDWPIIFLLVILKIPVLYLCGVVYWAIKSAPEPPPGRDTVRVASDPHPPWRPRPRRVDPLRGGPHSVPTRRYSRPGYAAAARAQRR